MAAMPTVPTVPREVATVAAVPTVATVATVPSRRGDGRPNRTDRDRSDAPNLTAVFDSLVADPPRPTVSPLTVLAEVRTRRSRRARIGGGIVAAAVVVGGFALVLPHLGGLSTSSNSSAAGSAADVSAASSAASGGPEFAASSTEAPRAPIAAPLASGSSAAVVGDRGRGDLERCGASSCCGVERWGVERCRPAVAVRSAGHRRRCGRFRNRRRRGRRAELRWFVRRPDVGGTVSVGWSRPAPATQCVAARRGGRAPGRLGHRGV